MSEFSPEPLNGLKRTHYCGALRLADAGQKVVLAANYWGKVKTVVQMITIIVYLLPVQSSLFSTLGILLAYASLVLTLLSGFIYLWENRQVFTEQN